MYDPQVNGERLTFGVSGLLYESTVLFYDRQGRSLWSQLSHEAISGPHRGTTLPLAPFTDTTWGEWRRRHPETLVLSRETGHRRSYGLDPYSGRRGLMFPVSHVDRRLSVDTPVLGIEWAGKAKAFPVAELLRAPREFHCRLGDEDLVVTNDPPGVRVQVHTAGGTSVPAIRVKWFAWAAFHRDTAVYAREE